MGLSDFERELAESKVRSSKHNHGSESSHHRRSSHKRSSDDEHGDRERRHRHKRRRRREDDNEDDEDRRRRKEERRARRAEEERAALSRDFESQDDVESGPHTTGLRADEQWDEHPSHGAGRVVERDGWMQAPSMLDVDYVNRVQQSTSLSAQTKFVPDASAQNLRGEEPSEQLRNINQDSSPAHDRPEQHDVSYEFGDAGSQWRMTKLGAVYRQAEESGDKVEDVAQRRYGSLREFDNAREEEIELDRRKAYGTGYVGKIKPSGELFEERLLSQGKHRHPSSRSSPAQELPQGRVVESQPAPMKTVLLDQTALNRLKAQMMRAKLRGGPEAARLEAEYNAAVAGAANHTEAEVVVLSTMDNRMLAGDRSGEVKQLTNKRGRERGLVDENEDMSIEDMIRQERRTKGAAGGSGREMADRIAKDTRFVNDLDYMDENAEKLSKRVAKSDVKLKDMAIGDFQKMQRALENCPLCHHEDRNPPVPPIAPIASLATRVYLTLPTEPELSEGGAMLVPVQHRTNLLECDDDEWEEIRNFMKCLTRMYHDQGRAVVFYENAAAPHRRNHAAMQAVPLPYEMGDTVPAFFREAILSADEEWTQHKKLIDTLKRSKEGLGKLSFRRCIAKEMPYFHVWFELDGGLGHVVEDERRWPKGDLFAREVIGGMLDLGPEITKRQGRWQKGDRRLEGWKKGWRKFDWTRVLTDG